VQSPAEVAAEEARKCSDREQEVGASWQPGLSIRGEATGRHEIVHMRVVAQVTRPGVEDSDQANLAADETRITCQSLGRRGRRPKQEIAKKPLMPTGHAPKAGGQGEGEQEVRHGEKEPLLLGQPGLGLLVLALGAMTVAAQSRHCAAQSRHCAAGVVPVLNLIALRTGVDVPTQSLGPTLLDGAQRTAMAGQRQSPARGRQSPARGQPLREALAIALAVAADNFRQL
jgi:hypothetical protein